MTLKYFNFVTIRVCNKEKSRQQVIVRCKRYYLGRFKAQLFKSLMFCIKIVDEHCHMAVTVAM